jgi:3-demethoxyubiquinol 3-hydroxylase
LVTCDRSAIAGWRATIDNRRQMSETIMSVAATIAPLSVGRALRVNHAGEYGAVRIYQAQLLLAHFVAPDLVAFLVHTLRHEIAHRDRFRKLMTQRGVYVCGALPLWGVGGFVLGIFTGLLGRTAILVCTEAVESTVHHHLGDQLAALGTSDFEVSTAIREIQMEELQHLEFAEHGTPPDALIGRFVRPLVAGSTALLIWLSTYGEAWLLQRLLRDRMR